MYGYERGDDNKPRVIPEQAEVVRRIYDSYLAGMSVRRIKEMLEAENIPTVQGGDTWSVGVFQRMLRNEKYCGEALLQKTFRSDCISRKVIKNTGQRPQYLIQNNHEAIVDRHIFRRVQAEIARRAGSRAESKKNCITGLKRYSSKYALTDLLICGSCGAAYKRCTWAKNGKTRIVWRCTSRLDYGTKYCKDSPSVDEDRLHEAILAAINASMSHRDELLRDIGEAVELMGVTSADTASAAAYAKGRLTELESRSMALMDEMLASRDLSLHQNEMRALTEEMADLRKQLDMLQRQDASQDEAKNEARVLIESLNSVSSEITEWNESIIRQLVDTVKVLSADKILVILESGDEIEQTM